MHDNISLKWMQGTRCVCKQKVFRARVSYTIWQRNQNTIKPAPSSQRGGHESVLIEMWLNCLAIALQKIINTFNAQTTLFVKGSCMDKDGA